MRRRWVAEAGAEIGQEPRCGAEGARRAEEGFLLLGAIVAIFLVLLVLSLAAPTVARQLRRDRELEAVHRGDQYRQAIRLYYKKFGHYPASMEELEKTNNIRFLRQKYVDPMTRKADWRLIHLGEQKTTVKGFFGKPLAGIATSGLGSVASSPGIGGTPGGIAPGVGAAGGGPGAGTGSIFGGSSASGGFGGTTATGTSSGTGTSPGVGTSGAGTSGAGSTSNGLASQPAGSFGGSGGPFVGVGSAAASGDSIVVLNEQTTYPTWEFIYDPRIEQMKSKANLLGGGMAGAGASGLGSLGSGSTIGTPAGSGTPAGTGTMTQTSPTSGQTTPPQ